MSEITFIRHAETDMAGTFCGQSDPPLNMRGRAQVGDLIARLAPCAFDAIYSSDLRRAVNTAMPLAQKLSVPCVTSPNLRELHFGDWEGMSWKEIEMQYPEYARRWTEAFPALPAPAGERFTEFEHRVLSEIDHLRRAAIGKKLAVVTHGGVMRVVLQKILERAEQQAWELTKPYCCSFVLSAEVGPAVEQ